MARPVKFEGQTHVFQAPNGMGEGDCGDLPTISVDMGENIAYVSCWKLTPEELEEVKRTGTIWCGCIALQPPIFLDGFRPFKTEDEHKLN